MNKIFRTFRPLVMVLFCLNTACARGKDTYPALAAPEELRAAKLLYSRGDGIYLQTPGDPRSRKLLENAAYPRWSLDGKSFTYISGSQVMLYEFERKSTRSLAQGERLRAVAFHPGGQEVWFIDDKSIRAIELAGGSSRIILASIDARELDIARDGNFFAATVKGMTGYRVEVFDPSSGKSHGLGRGCSVSISPDMRYITVNTGDHTQLSLRNRTSGNEWKSIFAPANLKLDNQKWSNHQDWIVSISEGEKRYVMAHRVDDGKTWRITPDSDCDRPDLFVP